MKRWLFPHSYMTYRNIFSNSISMAASTCCNSTLMSAVRFLLRFRKITPLWQQVSLWITAKWQLIYRLFIVMQTRLRLRNHDSLVMLKPENYSVELRHTDKPDYVCTYHLSLINKAGKWSFLSPHLRSLKKHNASSHSFQHLTTHAHEPNRRVNICVRHRNSRWKQVSEQMQSFLRWLLNQKCSSILFQLE